MTPRGEGRHCASCDKVVVDLTRLTRADEYKQVRALIEAMPLLLHNHPDLRLIIGGTGDDLAPLRQTVHDLALQHAIQLPGAIAAAELPDHYRLARLFALACFSRIAGTKS